MPPEWKTAVKMQFVRIARDTAKMCYNAQSSLAGQLRYVQKGVIMTLIVKSMDDNVISLPRWLMTHLNLVDGDSISPVVEGTALHLKPLQRFLALRGLLRYDDSYEKAIGELEASWQVWTFPESA